MPKGNVHALHPSFNADLLSASPEMAASAFVECGDLSVDDQGRVWRHRRKVGGNHPKIISIKPVRAENIMPSGRHQIQVYILGERVVCLASRLVWFVAHGEIPAGHHIHHKNGNITDNRIENLECIEGSTHISSHGVGRAPKNKGTKYGETSAYKKSLIARKINYAIRREETRKLWADGLTAKAISEIQGISTRQVYLRLQSR